MSAPIDKSGVTTKKSRGSDSPFGRRKKGLRSPLRGAARRIPGQSVDEKLQELRMDFMADAIATLMLLLFVGMEWLRYFLHDRINPWVWTAIAVPTSIWMGVKTWRRVGVIRRMRLGR